MGPGAAKRNDEIKIHLEPSILENNGALKLLGKESYIIIRIKGKFILQGFCKTLAMKGNREKHNEGEIAEDLFREGKHWNEVRLWRSSLRK